MLFSDRLPALNKPAWRRSKYSERCQINSDEFRFNLADSQLGIGREVCFLSDCCLSVYRMQVHLVATSNGIRRVDFRGKNRQVIRDVLTH